MSKALIAVVGPSGSGKSTSLRNLDPSKVILLDGERKGFPFPGSKRYNILPFADFVGFNKVLDDALKDTTREIVVTESFTKVAEYLLVQCQKAYTGWDVFGNYAKMMRAMLNKCKASNKIIVFTAIDDIVELPETDGSTTARRFIGVHGKELRGKIDPEFLMILYTMPRRNASGGIDYMFQTNNNGVTTAKTPMGMFKEQYIPNDLQAVIERAAEHFGDDWK